VLRIFHKEYLKVNSLGTIPCLIDGDTKLTESCAIPTYLLQKYRKGSSLEILPTEYDYGSYLNFIAHADATLTFPLTVYLRYSKFETKKGLSQAGEEYEKWFRARLRLVNETLENGRNYLCGGRFTLADIAITYSLLLGENVGSSSKYTPQTAAYLKRMKARRSFQEALAEEKRSHAQFQAKL